MNFATISNRRRMTYKHYIKQPMKIVELKLKGIINKIPHLINALDGSIKHPLVKKYNKFPFN